VSGLDPRIASLFDRDHADRQTWLRQIDETRSADRCRLCPMTAILLVRFRGYSSFPFDRTITVLGLPFRIHVNLTGLPIAAVRRDHSDYPPPFEARYRRGTQYFALGTSTEARVLR